VPNAFPRFNYPPSLCWNGQTSVISEVNLECRCPLQCSRNYPPPDINYQSSRDSAAAGYPERRLWIFLRVSLGEECFLDEVEKQKESGTESP